MDEGVCEGKGVVPRRLRKAQLLLKEFAAPQGYPRGIVYKWKNSNLLQIQLIEKVVRHIKPAE